MPKGKAKKSAAPVIEEKFAKMTLVELEKFIAENEPKLISAQQDRNYLQLERDTIDNFYSVTKEELSNLEIQCNQLDREMEEVERNFRIDMRVYLQKIKHLQFEHKTNEKNLKIEENVQIDEENAIFGDRTDNLKMRKANLKLQLSERTAAYEEEIREIKRNNQKSFNRIQDEFDSNLTDRRTEFEQKLEKLKFELELKRKVEVHELEERINQHINDLMKNHDKNFSQIKNYYNDITKDNLNLIKSLKDAINQLETKAEINSKLMHEIAQENKRLFGPLNAALEEVKNLKIALKDYNKNKTKKINTINRLNQVLERIKVLQVEHQNLKEEFEKVSQEREMLYDKFDTTVSSIERKANLKNIVLGRKIESINSDYLAKDKQFKEILAAANLDPSVEATITTQLNDLIQEKDQIVNDLEYAIIRVTKSHNDIIRTYQSKLQKLGVPTDDLTISEVSTEASRGPAGLVVQGF